LASSSSVAGGWLETIHGVKAALVDPGAALDVLSAIEDDAAFRTDQMRETGALTAFVVSGIDVRHRSSLGWRRSSFNSAIS